MATLISVHKLGKSQSTRTLFENISFGIEEASKVALIGPNGAGKTTLLRILSGREEADEGSISASKQCRIAFLEQTPLFQDNHTLLETVLERVSVNGDADIYHETKAYELISKLGFDDAGIYASNLTKTLSGGWLKKAALARELILEPNLLLLDEPTNHLDIESILWLENFLNNSNFATLTITHDRSFLQNTSTIIIELNRCYSTGFLKIEGDYAQFCEVKADILSGQEQAEESASNRLRREMEWMRRGPKARATKQKARINQAEELQEIVGKMQYRSRIAPARIEFKNYEKSPKKLIDAKHISKTFEDKVIFKDFDLLIERNSRIGLIGANGSGKSTLIKAVLGDLEVDSGKVERSDLLKLNYLEQDKHLENSESNLLNFFSEGGNKISFCGQWIDPRSYLARFGFAPDQLSTDVKKLSGGEKARLLIAKLMLNESNLLVLDEPTNDLDLATLNILEDELENYKGALLLVSHDRYFLDNVCSEIYAFSPNPSVTTLTRFADIYQWERWHTQELKNIGNPATPSESPHLESPPVKTIDERTKKRKLSFKEKIELEGMEGTIQNKEELLLKLTEELQNPGAKNVVEISQQMAALQLEIDTLYERWGELAQETP